MRVVQAHGFAERQDFFWGIRLRKELPSRQIDAFVGRLRGKNDGNEQFERRGILQFRGWVRIDCFQASENFMPFS